MQAADGVLGMIAISSLPLLMTHCVCFQQHLFERECNSSNVLICRLIFAGLVSDSELSQPSQCIYEWAVTTPRSWTVVYIMDVLVPLYNWSRACCYFWRTHHWKFVFLAQRGSYLFLRLNTPLWWYFAVTERQRKVLIERIVLRR